MELTEKQFAKIAPYFPKKRGNVGLSDLQVMNAILFVAENGCKWRALPQAFGNWHTIYMRMNRWAKKGVLDRVFAALQRHAMIKIKPEFVCLDSTSIKVHPHGSGALKKTVLNLSDALEQDGLPSFLWLPRMLKQW